MGAHPLSYYLLGRFSEAGRGVLAADGSIAANTDALLATFVREFRVIVNGERIYSDERFSGVKLRRSTQKLLKALNGQTNVPRLNRLLLEDFFFDDLAHDSCNPVDRIVKKGIAFRIYCERRRLKTKWNVSYKITYPTADGLASTHARTLDLKQASCSG